MLVTGMERARTDPVIAQSCCDDRDVLSWRLTVGMRRMLQFPGFRVSGFPGFRVSGFPGPDGRPRKLAQMLRAS